MANSGKKGGVLFGRKIAFKIGGATSSSRRGSRGGGQAAPLSAPPTPFATKKTPPPSDLPPLAPAPPETLVGPSWPVVSSPPPPRPPPPPPPPLASPSHGFGPSATETENQVRKGGDLFCRKIEFEIGASSNRARRSSGGGQAPSPLDARSSPELQLPALAPAPAGIPSVAALPSLPPPLPLQLYPLDHRQNLLDGVGNQGYMGSIENDISRDAPVKLLSGKRTYVQPPVDHDHLDLTDITTLGCLEDATNQDSKDRSEYQNKTLDAIGKESAAFLEFLVGPPLNHPDQPSAPKRTLGCQTTPKVTECVSVDNSTKGRCYFHTKAMRRLDHFLDERKLTKTIEIPGTSTSPRITNAALMETRLILRSIRPLYKLHRDGYCLDGSFCLNNFLIDENLLIALEYQPENRKEYSKERGCADFQRFVKMVQDDVFGAEDIPNEICDWLSLIQSAGTDYEYLVSYDSALMECNQVLSTFMQLYSKLIIMETSDYAGYKFVLKQLQPFAGWDILDLHNEHFIGTYWWRDPITGNRTSYGSDVRSLLRLIRNTFQHIMMKTVDINGRITFKEEEYENILNDQFPRLLRDFMKAMYIAAYLAELNLEHVMV